MECYPQKCQVPHNTSKRKPVKSSYTIHDQTLKEANIALYIGVTLQNNLSWNKHIDATAKKANNTRSFLQRNLHRCPLLRSFVTRPGYGRSWNMPVLSGTLSLRLEMVQRRVARMVFSRLSSSVTPMLQQLQCQGRRAQAKVFMIYRIVNNLWSSQQTTWHQLYQ